MSYIAGPQEMHWYFVRQAMQDFVNLGKDMALSADEFMEGCQFAAGVLLSIADLIGWDEANAYDAYDGLDKEEVQAAERARWEALLSRSTLYARTYKGTLELEEQILDWTRVRPWGPGRPDPTHLYTDPSPQEE